MAPCSSTELHTALDLVRSGRFFDAVELLQRDERGRRNDRRPDLLANAVLADALQRVGQNERAQQICVRNLPRAKQLAHLAARYHFVLGNIDRERGYAPGALEHFQIAISGAGTDLELACWSQLRLIRVIAEISGIQTAFARLDDAKRFLARWGDARAFATLHLWLVEAESTRGCLENARRHLRIAESLLLNVDDVWLRGYMAINSSALHYYSADMTEAQRCAREAIQFAQMSGHRATLLAAHANLGNIEFVLGALPEAERCFEVALGFCEKGSVNEIAILDSIAQLHLQLGDLEKCKLIVSKLEQLISENEHAKRRHYSAFALLTKVRLLLRDGNFIEALQLSRHVNRLVHGSPHGRMTTDVRILCIETLLACGEFGSAVKDVVPELATGSHLSPDLFAQLEHVIGRTLASSKAFEQARIHLSRAILTFSVIGHSLGAQRSQREMAAIPDTPAQDYGIASRRSLDRLRALLDLRSRPELFGHEAVAFLEELDCTEGIDLSIEFGEQRICVKRVGIAQVSMSHVGISIMLNPDCHRIVILTYWPKDEAIGRLTSAAFERVIRKILSISVADTTASDTDIAWNSDGGSLTKDGAVFACDQMLAVLRTVKQIAPTDVSVLITGETGTGKEVIARAIHEHSVRSSMPFLALNCAAVPKDLLESQLFGHKKGAFSGASETYLGIVRAANGGTLFLDEIGELPLEMQAKLLRFLEMSEVHPIGESFPVHVDVRLIFATNGDLEEAVARNRFRRDLFYRLHVVPIRIPPLRERKEEIPILANVFAQRFAAELSKKPVQLSEASMERLILHSWPGNVRELSNEIRRLTVLRESSALVTPHDLSPALQPLRQQDRALNCRTGPYITVGIDQRLDTATNLLEIEMVKHALRQSNGHVSTAASMLGISRKGLYLKRLRLGLIDFRDDLHCSTSVSVTESHGTSRTNPAS